MHTLDCVASIKIELMSNGAMSVSGNIGDVKLALQMLDAARDSVKNQIKERDKIVIPNYDVDTTQDPAFPTKAFGDMRPEDRGDA
jgi:hypothetical protein